MNTATQPALAKRRRTPSRAGEVGIAYAVTVVVAVLIQTLMPGHLWGALIMGIGTLVTGYLYGFFLLLPVVLGVLRWAFSGWRFAIAALVGSQLLYFALWCVHPLLRLDQPLAAYAQEYTIGEVVRGGDFMHNGLLYAVSLSIGLAVVLWRADASKAAA